MDTPTEEVRSTLESIAGLLHEAGATIEFLAVHAAAGADDSFEPVRGAAVRPVRAASNLYGGHLRAAVQAARGQWLVTLDHPTPDDAPLVFAFWHRRQEADVLIASRYVWGGSAVMPFMRQVLSRGLNRLYRWALDVPVHDLSSDRRMYRTRVIQQLAIEHDDFEVLMEVLLKFMSKGGRVLEVPWHFQSEHYRQRPNTALRLITSSLATLRQMHYLRNGIAFADYDYRAYDSRIWFQRYWQRKRFQIIRAYTRNQGFTLDAGCGTSRIITTRPDMIALDFNFGRLRYIRKSNPRRVHGSISQLPFPDACFDCVVTSQVIEHIPERNGIEECARVLKPGGTLVAGTPDYGRPWWPMIEKVYDFVKPTGYAEEHITHYTLQMLIGEIVTNGCTVIDYKYICGGELIVCARKKEPEIEPEDVRGAEQDPSMRA